MADYANQQQKIKEATEQLEAGIKEFFSSDKFQEYGRSRWLLQSQSRGLSWRRS
ncbi:MAG: hypothetical protein MR939_07445 [Clostridiales bacterium]|nr:hypothetical protein [Clostridiales bacterium]MDD7386494.1 hypothetical protein [Bacillota bacterium]